LRNLIALMPRLRVVILHGAAAAKGWKLFLRQHHGMIERRGIVWLETYHTSRQALQTPDRVERELREASIRNAFSLAAAVMRSPIWPTVESEPRFQQSEPETVPDKHGSGGGPPDGTSANDDAADPLRPARHT